ncbi:hypothetical protein C942_02682 [Photobacterium marinum]|uniref:Apea-like HEPN domain-containing protein n=1 Tax=Photobacterium marinum TaxID=1056511 RepID=L8JI59_9GAMM|nr:hypothetical protein [Photobacterium marinum]ELR67174.1 hypothetical protein C942_02682 [Photobacterium marinum]
MSLKNNLIKLVDALFEANSPGFDWGSEKTFPDFLTTDNGYQIHFSSSAREYLRKLAQILCENRLDGGVKIELPSYIQVVRKVVANMLSEGLFDGSQWHEDRQAIKELKKRIDSQLDKIAKEHTHYFPAWTFHMERSGPIEVGPVKIMTREDWLDEVDFSENAKRRFGLESGGGIDWKASVKEALNDPRSDVSLPDSTDYIYDAIKVCHTVVGVTISGYEAVYSERFAKLACKAALDSISLIIGYQDAFLQQSLYGERLPPIRTYTLLETNGYLHLPGSALSKRVVGIDGDAVLKELSDFPISTQDIGRILEGVINPDSSPWPKLALRWTTALNWLAEACREESDQTAIAKLGTSLDVLACGGKHSGIADMVANFTGIGKKSVVNKSTGQTLSSLIRVIYEEGRSQILHGTNIDRLKSLKQERADAYNVARISLLEAAHGLMTYEGPDDDKAFRTMTAQVEQQE